MNRIRIIAIGLAALLPVGLAVLLILFVVDIARADGPAIDRQVLSGGGEIPEVTVFYTGETAVPIDTTLHLSALVEQVDDGEPCDLGLALVQYEIKDSANSVVDPIISFVSESGISSAAVTADFPVGDYQIETKVTGGFCTSPTIESPLQVTERGTITIVKHANPINGASFEFTITGRPNFTLTHDQEKVFDDLLPISPYIITEIIPPGWTLLGVSCDTAFDLVRDANNVLIGTRVELGSVLSATCTFTNNKPNAAILGNFETIAGPGQVEIRWTTIAEKDTVGFNIMRSTSLTDTFAAINNSLILAQGDEFSGANYSFIDNEVTDGNSYYYYLQEVALNGVIDHKGGPGQILKATPGNPPTTIYLPLITKGGLIGINN